jgi:hypothetical protein
VEKLECVGNIQKRVSGRLRKLKTSHKEKLSDGKTLGGRGRLTEKVINKLQKLLWNCHQTVNWENSVSDEKSYSGCFISVQKENIWETGIACVLYYR